MTVGGFRPEPFSHESAYAELPHGSGEIIAGAFFCAPLEDELTHSLRWIHCRLTINCMPRNVEIKARINNVEALHRAAAAIADEGPVEIAQDDTFFACDNGRLKLRKFADDHGELIFYRRADDEGPKESFYLRSPTSEPDTLRESLAQAYGKIGRVLKTRTQFLVGRTRIHIDHVDGLGEFLELEVVLEEGESAEQGIKEAEKLLLNLGIPVTQLVRGAYVDLITSSNT